MNCENAANAYLVRQQKKLSGPARASHTDPPLSCRMSTSGMRRGDTAGASSRFRQESGCNEAEHPWWCDMDSIKEDRVERMLASWATPLQSKFQLLEKRCEELAQRLDACELCIGQTSALKSRVVMLEATCLAQTDLLNEKVDDNLDLEVNSEMLGASSQMSSRGCSQSLQRTLAKQGGQTLHEHLVSPSRLALPKAQETLSKLKTRMANDHSAPSTLTFSLDADGFQAKIAKAQSVADGQHRFAHKVNELAKLQETLSKLKTCMAKDHIASSNQPSGLDPDGFEANIAKAQSVADGQHLFPHEVNELAKLQASPRQLLGSVSTISRLHDPESACLQRAHSHDPQEQCVLGQRAAVSEQRQQLPLLERRACLANKLRVLQGRVSGNASRGLSWHAQSRFPAVPEVALCGTGTRARHMTA